MSTDTAVRAETGRGPDDRAVRLARARRRRLTVAVWITRVVVLVEGAKAYLEAVLDFLG